MSSDFASPNSEPAIVILAEDLVVRITSSELVASVRAPEANYADWEVEVLNQTNLIRRQHGLSELAAHPLLREAAWHHSCDMAARGLISHVGADGSSVSDRV